MQRTRDADSSSGVRAFGTRLIYTIMGLRNNSPESAARQQSLTTRRSLRGFTISRASLPWPAHSRHIARSSLIASCTLSIRSFLSTKKRSLSPAIKSFEIATGMAIIKNCQPQRRRPTAEGQFQTVINSGKLFLLSKSLPSSVSPHYFRISRDAVSCLKTNRSNYKTASCFVWV